MVMCFVPDCKHYSEQNICKFFEFPAKPEERKAWIQLIRREDREPSKHSLVCSCHFKNQDRKNRPTLFEFNVKRKLDFTSPEKRKRRSTSTSAAQMTIVDTETTVGNGTNLCEAGPSTSQPTTSGASREAENYFLREEVQSLSQKLQHLSVSFSYEHIKTNDSHILMYTGIPTHILYMTLYETMENIPLTYYAKWQVKKVEKIDQLLMTLVKLRLNLPHEDLALRFNYSSATVTNIIMTWIYAIHEIFFKQLMKNQKPKIKPAFPWLLKVLKIAESSLRSSGDLLRKTKQYGKPTAYLQLIQTPQYVESSSRCCS